jgi:large subunit ribosomal protein L4
MQVEVLNWDEQVVSQSMLDIEIFDLPTRTDIIKIVIDWQRAKARAGTHSTKTRENVSGTTKKFGKQKGGGVARHGSRKAPIFIGGGITFGPHPRDHAFSLNKKIRNLGLKSILSTRFRENNLIVMKDFELEEGKTSNLAAKVKKLGLENKKILLVDSTIPANLKLAANNLKKVNTLPVIGLNVLDITKNDKIIITLSGLQTLKARLGL